MNYVTGIPAPNVIERGVMFIIDAQIALKDRYLAGKRQQHTRASLIGLTDRELRDIGLTRTDVNALDTSAAWSQFSPSAALNIRDRQIIRDQ